MRSCDGCRLCCRVFPLPVLDKPAGEWCRHIGPTGCSIHPGLRVGHARGEMQRPEICGQYDCYWREHDELPEPFRPDRIGAVATEQGTVAVGWRFLPMVVVQEDAVDATCAGRSAELAAWFVERGMAVMVIRGGQSRIEFDRVRYPEVSAAAIESSLRDELSRDAEELRRLGAVDAGAWQSPGSGPLFG